ncbi:MAG: outer membrane beta-barrel protein [Parafilimonas sp.]
MKALKIAPFVLCILLASQVNAQRGQLKMDIQYSYALPLGSFKNNVINNGSPRGVAGDILYNVNNKLSVGLGLGVQDFYQKYPRDVYKTGANETTSAVVSNSVQVLPVLAKAEFYPLGGKKSAVQPYINAGAGIGVTSFTQYLGEFGGTDNSAAFMLQGGAGIIVPFCARGTSGFKVGANYNMISYNRNGFNNFNNLGLQAGVFFPIK